MEIQAHAATGVRIALCLKRVDGRRVPPREWAVLDIVPASIQVEEVSMMAGDDPPSNGALERSNGGAAPT